LIKRPQESHDTHDCSRMLPASWNVVPGAGIEPSSHRPC